MLYTVKLRFFSGNLDVHFVDRPNSRHFDGRPFRIIENFLRRFLSETGNRYSTSLDINSLPAFQLLQGQPDELVGILLDQSLPLRGNPDALLQVSVRPHRQVGHHMDQVLAHGSQVVQLAAPAFRMGHGRHQARPFEFFQPVGKDAAGDLLLGVQHVLVFVKAGEHQVANDQQSPVIADDIQAAGDRAAGTVFMFNFGDHK